MAAFAHLPEGASRCYLTRGEVVVPPTVIDELSLHDDLGVDTETTPYVRFDEGDDVPLSLADRLFPAYTHLLAVDTEDGE